jgi:hypothetical protein
MKEAGEEDEAHESSDWGCIGCLVEEFMVFPLALLAAVGIRTWLGWGALEWRDFLLAIVLVALFYGVMLAIIGLLERGHR